MPVTTPLELTKLLLVACDQSYFKYDTLKPLQPLSELGLFEKTARGVSRRCASIFAFLCAVVLVALVRHASAAAPVVRSFDIELHYSGNLHWIDDRRLALMALVKVGDDQLTQFRGQRVGKLAVVDVDSGEIRWGEEFTGQLCVNGPDIAYFTVQQITAPTRAERIFITYGRLGKLTRREVKREDLQAQGFDFIYSCKPVLELPVAPPAAAGEFMKRLRVEHGFAAFEQRGSREFPTKFYRARQPQEPVPLTALRGEDVVASWPYVPFKNAYWISQAVRTIPVLPPGTYKAWWLHPDGRVDPAVELDLQKSLNGPSSLVPAFPVRTGFLAIEVRTGRKPLLGNIGRSGLYRLEANGKYEKLLAGTITPWAVSPSGCRVAIGHDDRRDDESSERLMLKILDVCGAK